MKRLVFSLLISCFPFISNGQKSTKKYFVYFDVDKYVLTPDAKKTLDSISKEVKNTLSYQITIKAHSDNSGEERSNRLLSNNRAKAVFLYFKKMNLDTTAIKRMGFSDTIPTASNDNVLGKSKNRRAEIIVTKVLKITQEELTTGTPETSLKIGARFILRGINFEYDKYTFTPDSKPALELLLKLMQDHPTMQIEIDGHVCCRDAMGLSSNRAHAVRYYLLKNEIFDNRITCKGFSNYRKLTTEETEEGKRKNRRVEILIVNL